jgi:anti-anti-sigma factor
VATLAEWMKVDAENVARDLQLVCTELHNADGEVVLDLSAVRRVDSAAMAALNELVARADENGVRIVLRAVPVEVYKVLKLVRLSPHFSFIA